MMNRTLVLVCVLGLYATACTSDDPAPQTPPSAVPVAAKAPAGSQITSDADYEAKELEIFQGANSILVAGVHGDCDQLAAELAKFNAGHHDLAKALVAYDRAHRGAHEAMEAKLDSTLRNFENSAEPTFAHCKGNKAFLAVVTKPIVDPSER